MDKNEGGQVASPPIAILQDTSACYVYCIVPAAETQSLSDKGIGGRDVFSIVYGDLGALIHLCPPLPYQSEDPDVLASWVLEHHRVVETAWRRWGTVLPLAFNTILGAKGTDDPGHTLTQWLEAEYDSLKQKLEALRGKAEYGVQAFWDTPQITRDIMQTTPEIRKLEQEMHTSGPGLVYMNRQRLERLLKKEMETKAGEESRELCSLLQSCTERVQIERPKVSVTGPKMLINFSCLVSSNRVPEFEAQIKEFETREGRSIRLVGPFPPYSFC